jgi:hypothetical protein
VCVCVPYRAELRDRAKRRDKKKKPLTKLMSFAGAYVVPPIHAAAPRGSIVRAVGHEWRVGEWSSGSRRGANERTAYGGTGEDEDEEGQEAEAEPAAKKTKLKFGSMGKNPDVLTGFLPDR